MGVKEMAMKVLLYDQRGYLSNAEHYTNAGDQFRASVSDSKITVDTHLGYQLILGFQNDDIRNLHEEIGKVIQEHDARERIKAEKRAARTKNRKEKNDG